MARRDPHSVADLDQGRLTEAALFLDVDFTAKTLTDYATDSYGMALPAETIVEFFEAHLPDYDPGPSPPEDEPALEWDVIDARVGPSVLMIMEGD